MMKLVVVLALVACASAAPGVVAGVLPASTGPLTYSAVVAGPQVIAGPQVLAGPQVIAGPQVLAGPQVYAAAGQTVVAHAPTTIVAQSVAYPTAPKITHVHEPVEQHGYQIAY